jgi:hypothetical protein
VAVGNGGKFQLFSSDTTKSIRVVVTAASLPGSDQSDSLTVTLIPGANYALALATHWVVRYRDPQAEIICDLDLSEAIHADRIIRVSDILEITSSRIVTRAKPRWTQERIFVTSASPDFAKKKIGIEAIQTSFTNRYGFIAPSSMTNDYDAASAAEREYAFIADGSGFVGSDDDPPYLIW